MSPVKLLLPEKIDACLFDMDGVLTDTASTHAAAWKEMFDDYLRRRATLTGEPFRPFDIVKDYDLYVDGRTRTDGASAFLASRGITLPEGKADDPPGAETLRGLGNRKNELLLARIRSRGVKAFPGSVRFVHAVHDAGIKCAVVSSSANTQEVITSVGIESLFDARIDGVVIDRDHLASKPAPDSYLAAAKLLDIPPAAAAVFEDALAGVEAGRAGKFGYVVGVDRVGQADELRKSGADVVVRDLAELMVEA